MNTMKRFYVTISSAPQVHGSYLEALSKIANISRQQTTALQSERGWQQWTEPQQEPA
jgi:hypothetical protein